MFLRRQLRRHDLDRSAYRNEFTKIADVPVVEAYAPV
jgi:hypothetical protein